MIILFLMWEVWLIGDICVIQNRFFGAKKIFWRQKIFSTIDFPWTAKNFIFDLRSLTYWRHKRYSRIDFLALKIFTTIDLLLITYEARSFFRPWHMAYFNLNLHHWYLDQVLSFPWTAKSRERKDYNLVFDTMSLIPIIPK